MFQFEFLSGSNLFAGFLNLVRIQIYQTMMGTKKPQASVPATKVASYDFKAGPNVVAKCQDATNGLVLMPRDMTMIVAEIPILITGIFHNSRSNISKLSMPVGHTNSYLGDSTRKMSGMREKWGDNSHER